VYALAFSPNGKILASGTYSGVTQLWNIETGEVLGTLKGHDIWVSSVAFSPRAYALNFAGFVDSTQDFFEKTRV